MDGGYGTAGSRRSVTPTAPPQEDAMALEDSRDPAPPGYEAVLAGDSVARQTAAEVRHRNLVGSFAYAGTYVRSYSANHNTGSNHSHNSALVL